MQYFRQMYKLTFLLLFACVLLLQSSCSDRVSTASGRSRKVNFNEQGDGYSSTRSKRTKRPPQMGFYQKKNRGNVFKTASFKIKYLFANKSKRHKLGNDQRSTSTKHNKDKQKDSVGNTNKFAKKKPSKRGGKNKTGDGTAQ